MSCSKYYLTNTGNTIVTFNYQRCDDAMWEYQVELSPSESKTIWLLNNTYSSPLFNSIVQEDLGGFPITPTPTPSTTPPSTPGPTPSVTPTLTQTPTPTNVLRTTLFITGHSESSAVEACSSGTSTIFVNGPSLADSTLAWSNEYGPNTGDPGGYYVEDGIVYYINGGCDIGCSSGATIAVYGTCS